jgi:hypothetical protein
VFKEYLAAPGRHPELEQGLHAYVGLEPVNVPPALLRKRGGWREVNISDTLESMCTHPPRSGEGSCARAQAHDQPTLSGECLSIRANAHATCTLTRRTRTNAHEWARECAHAHAHKFVQVQRWEFALNLASLFALTLLHLPPLVTAARCSKHNWASHLELASLGESSQTSQVHPAPPIVQIR